MNTEFPPKTRKEKGRGYPPCSYRVHNMTDHKISIVPFVVVKIDSLADLRLSHELRDGETSLRRLKIGSSKVAEAQTSRAGVDMASGRVHEVEDIFDRVTIATRAKSGVIVERINLDTAKMGILAVLVVLEDLHLNDPSDEGVAVRATAGASDGNLLPAGGILESHGSKLDEIVLTGAGLEDDLGRGVGLVFVVVNVEANVTNTNTLGEVHGELVRLRAIGSEKC